MSETKISRWSEKGEITAAISRSVNRLFSGQFNVLWHSLYSKFRGVDLEGETVEALGLNPAEARPYENSGGPFLESVLKTIDIPAGSRVIDFGSGKGGASFTMANFPFEEVLGVELSAELVTISKRNASILKQSKVYFECKSATELTTELDRFTHVYFFNPFSPEIFREVRENLVDSLKRKPRRLTVICKHPEGSIADCFPESDVFRLVKKFEFKVSHPFYVFTSVDPLS